MFFCVSLSLPFFSFILFEVWILLPLDLRPILDLNRRLLWSTFLALFCLECRFARLDTTMRFFFGFWRWRMAIVCLGCDSVSAFRWTPILPQSLFWVCSSFFLVSFCLVVACRECRWFSSVTVSLSLSLLVCCEIVLPPPLSGCHCVQSPFFGHHQAQHWNRQFFPFLFFSYLFFLAFFLAFARHQTSSKHTGKMNSLPLDSQCSRASHSPVWAIV